ncbi:hypothetical protein MIS45_04220 [Wielerella bovis]|uniref:hypothetical protein n=1 Tax=Wielerella bovis TaxID=2917790 RepID=UPI0020193F6D|nr:hypothetical protein [Wielerella bovis]ULJ70039.1 hypothetical protein MIS45_04220 [Wielerella bovis]
MQQLSYSLNDLENLAHKQSGKVIRFTQTGDNQIRVNYLLELQLTLIGHTDDALKFKYSFGSWAAGLLAKGAERVWGDIRTKKLTLDTQAKIIQVNLAVFAAFAPYFKTHHIQAAVIRDNTLMVDLIEK